MLKTSTKHGFGSCTRPSVTADILVVSGDGGDLRIVLIERAKEPFKGALALPGGFLDEGERSVDAALRELSEETGMEPDAISRHKLMYLGVYDTLGRDPRGWVQSHAYCAIVTEADVELAAASDAAAARWYDRKYVEQLTREAGGLAFDHAAIIKDGLRKLAGDEPDCVPRKIKRLVRGYRLSDYVQPSNTADILVLSINEETAELQVVLVKRGEAPYEGHWALPGGFLKELEQAEAAARRELAEEANIHLSLDANPYLVPLGSYDKAGRDPRGWVRSEAFLTFVPMDQVELVASTDAVDARWHSISEVEQLIKGDALAFDHAEIIQDARQRLADLGSDQLQPEIEQLLKMLPERFTMRHAQTLFAAIGSRWADDSISNFKKKFTGKFAVEDLGKTLNLGRKQRPAELFKLIGLKGKSEANIRK